MNLFMLLEMAEEGAADRVVLGTRAQGLTATQLRRRAQRAALWFTRAEISHVGFVDLNSNAVPIALFGAALANLPFAPINYRLTDHQLLELVRSLTPAMILSSQDSIARIRDRADVIVAAPEELVDGTAEIGDVGDTPGVGAVDPDAVAIMLFTSGTTGPPKTALLRHRHLVSYVISTVEFMGAEENESQLVSVPPYHIAGMSTILTSLYSGRRIVYLPSFEAETWLRTVADEAITHAMLVPTMVGRILDLIEAREITLPSLRHLSYGGGRMPVALIERAMRLLPHVDFVNAYGLTETSSTIAILTPEDHRRAVSSGDLEVRQRLRSVGRPVPAVEIEIRDPDGTSVSQGRRGEVYVRGEQIAGEYLGRSVLTDDGWFPTKDAGYLDAGGFLFLEGRLDDVIVRGAENLSPAEIEDVLMAHDAVLAAAVVGVPDPEWGEAVVAAVVLAVGARASEEELQDWVRVRLRSTKTPQLIEFRQELPYNETGKLLRRVLRDEFSAARQSP